MTNAVVRACCACCCCCFLPSRHESISSPRPASLAGRPGVRHASLPMRTRDGSAMKAKCSSSPTWWLPPQQFSHPGAASGGAVRGGKRVSTLTPCAFPRTLVRGGAMEVLVSKHTPGFMTGERGSTLDPCCPCVAAWYVSGSRTPGFSAGVGSKSPVRICHCFEKSVTKTVESALGAASAVKPSK